MGKTEEIVLCLMFTFSVEKDCKGESGLECRICVGFAVNYIPNSACSKPGLSGSKVLLF